MEKTVVVKVRLQDGSVRDCKLSFSSTPPYTLRLSGVDLSEAGFEGRDLFEAMVMLRKELESRGALLLCAGARTDVFPSGMSRSMSGGRKAYVTKLGFPTGRKDIIDIFDAADPKDVGTVEQQALFREEWIRLLQERVAEISPMPGEVEEAKKFPNGYVYRISGRADPAEGIAPEAIVGAWQVGPSGDIVGGFIKNPKYDPSRWPSTDGTSGTLGKPN
jgi:hypothetical protein